MTKSSYEFGDILSELVFTTPHIAVPENNHRAAKACWVDGFPDAREERPGKDPGFGGAGPGGWSLRSLHRCSNGEKRTHRVNHSTSKRFFRFLFFKHKNDENEELAGSALPGRAPAPAARAHAHAARPCPRVPAGARRTARPAETRARARPARQLPGAGGLSVPRAAVPSF